MFTQTGGKPGPQPFFAGNSREVFYSARDRAQFVAKPSTIDGTLSSWADNTPYPFFLPAGLMIGKKTATAKWRNSIIGTVTVALTSGAGQTSVTVSAATATEIARLIAVTGGNVSLKLTGPPTASGVVATTAITCTAAAGTTLTVSSVTLPAYIAGTFVTPADGSETILSVVCDMEGLKVSDATNINRVDCFDPQILLAGGTLDTTMLINYPTDPSLQAYVIAAIKAYVIGVAFYSQL